MRTDSANSTAVQQDNVPLILFVEMEFASGNLYVTNAAYDFVWDSHTWVGLGNLGSIETLEEGAALKSYGIAFKLTGVDPTKLSLALNQSYQNKPARIWLAVLDENYAIVGTPTKIFEGLMDTMPITVGNVAEITVTAESRLVDWDRPRVRYYTDADQQARFPGDLGLQYVSQTVSKEIKWGVS